MPSNAYFPAVASDFPGVPAGFGQTPFTGIAELFYNLIPSLEHQFSGQARGAVTQDAIRRLVDSGNPVLIRYGRQLANLYASGTVLSTSSGPGRAGLNKAFGEAMQALEAQGYPRQEAFQVLRGFISSKQTFLPGTVLGEIVPLPNNPPAVFPPSPYVAPQPKPPAARVAENMKAVEAGQLNLFDRLNPKNFGPAEGAALGTAIPLVLGQPELLPESIKIGTALGEFNQEILQPGLKNLDKFVGQFFGQGGTIPVSPAPLPPVVSQPGSNPLSIPPIQGQPVEVPTLDQTKPCPSCKPPPLEIQNQLRRQLDELKNEVTTEQQQQQTKQTQDQQKQIDQLKYQESQPLEQRDIPRELQQKQQLIQQIESELQGQPSESIPQQGQPQQGGAPELQNYHPVQLEPVPHQGGPGPFIQRQPNGEYPSPLDNNAVKFCVQCTSQQESLKFLNGEPSECSVVPA